jgi:PEP-CTERM motif
MSGAPLEVANGLVQGSGSGGAFVENWTITKTFVFSQPVTIGQAQKDLLFFDGLSGTGISNVHYVKQTFTPVPEPASMAALGLGVVALIRRRRASK